MKKLFLILSLVALVLISGTVVAAARPTNVVVTITSSFDNSNKNLTHQDTTLPVGSLFSLNASNIQSSYIFAFWVINGVVRNDLAATSSIKLQTSMHIQAVFHKSGEHAVLFVDSNGKLISTEYVETGDPVSAPSYDGFSKPGLVINESTPWKSLQGSTTLTGINTSRVYVLQYQNPSTPVTVILSVTGGVATPSNPNRNDVVTLVANDLPSFKYWKDSNGNVLSYQSTFVFTALNDVTIIAETVNSKTPATLVTMSSDLAIRDDYETYVGRFELQSGHELVEWGFILSQDSVGLLTFNTQNRIVAKSNTFNATTNEFVMSFSEVTFSRIRAYIVVDNGTGLIEYYSYSQEIVPSDLFISEYIEGSSNNKAIEIYNGTGRDINLTGYSVKLFSNGSPTVSTNLNLSGILVNGDVYVIYNTSAISSIASVGDITSEVTFFNGDDAIGLYNGSTLIDLIGVIGVDPGTSWPVGTGATAEFTLVRKSSVLSFSGSFVEDEWDVYPQDTVTYLGSHTAITGTLSESQKIVLDTSAVSIPSSVKVEGNLTLPLSGNNGSTISWSSDSTHLITNLGVVSLPTGSPETAILTATITLGSLSKVKEFEVVVGKLDSERVSIAKTALVISSLITEAGSMGLPTTGSEGTTVTWSSDNVNVISNAGLVVLPETGSVVVNLTATISFGSSSDTKVFFVTVSSSNIDNYTVSFNTNGGTIYANQIIQSGQKASNPGTPIRTNSIFKGWFEQNLVTTFDFDQSITSDTTIYAVWESLLYSFNFLDGGSSSNSGYANTGLMTNVSYASDNPGGTSGTTTWRADYANLSATIYTRLGGLLESTEYGTPNANIRTDFAFNQSISKVEIVDAAKFGTVGRTTMVYLQISSNGTTWTTVASTTTINGTIVFSGLNIPAGSRIRITIALTAATSTNSGIQFTGIKVYGNPS